MKPLSFSHFVFIYWETARFFFPSVAASSSSSSFRFHPSYSENRCIMHIISSHRLWVCSFLLYPPWSSISFLLFFRMKSQKKLLLKQNEKMIKFACFCPRHVFSSSFRYGPPQISSSLRITIEKFSNFFLTFTHFLLEYTHYIFCFLLRTERSRRLNFSAVFFSPTFFICKYPGKEKKCKTTVFYPLLSHRNPPSSFFRVLRIST